MTAKNSGKRWLAKDIEELRNGMRLGVPIEELAEFLLRDADEIRAKAAELTSRLPAATRDA